MYIAVCSGVYYEQFGCGETVEEAKSLLWEAVHQYLEGAQAPETSEMNAQELENSFGCVIIKVAKGRSGYIANEGEDQWEKEGNK